MPAASARRYAAMQRLARRQAALARGQWARLPVPLVENWSALVPVVLALVVEGQLAAAAGAAPYTAAALEQQQIDAPPDAALRAGAFAGVASDGRSLAGLLTQPAVAASSALSAGATLPEARAAGAYALTRIVMTQIADAGRDAESVALAVRPRAAGWVRVLQLPSCARCVVLAGKYFRWNAGFARHPLCDCRHVPTSRAAARGLVVDPVQAVRSGQVRGLSQADLHAIVIDGADPGQVINARRGMSTVTAYGRRLKATTEGTTVRGAFGRSQTAAGVPTTRAGGARYRTTATLRLRPEEIYRQAGDDRALAIRLLARYGYTT